MAKNTITSADATFVLSVAGLYAAGVSIEGFATDAAFATPGSDVAETMLGVDGKMSAGWIPHTYDQTISLQADSRSIAVFDAIQQASDVARTIFWLNAVIQIPGISRSYVFSNGVLKNYKPLPDAGKTLQPVEFTITWESVKPAVI
jgi:hypothetical protein